MSWNHAPLAPTARSAIMYEKNRDESSGTGTRPSSSSRRRPSTALGTMRSSTSASRPSIHTKTRSRPQTPSTQGSFSSDPARNTSDIIMEASGTALRGVSPFSSAVQDREHVGPTKSSKYRTDEVVIHVFDEGRNAKRDFYCKKGLLLQEMKYFSAYLSDRTPSDNVKESSEIMDIDVHCDVEVFEWLMEYIVKKEVKMEPRTAVSILISSHFLQMNSLETICLQFIHDRIDEIVQIPIDLRCINKDLLAQLASLFSEEDLIKMTDPKDKIKSQLYLHKLNNLLASSPYIDPIRKQPLSVHHGLMTCKLCGKLYSRNKESVLVCEEASLSIGLRGDLQSLHEPDITGFEVNDFIARLYVVCQSWEKVYWYIWSTLIHFSCSVCEMVFPCLEMKSCRKHASEPVFPSKAENESSSHESKGFYRCCVETPASFAPFRLYKGCQLFDHVPDASTSDPRIFQLLENHRDKILWCYDDLYIMRSVLRRGSRQETDKGGISSIASTEEEQIDAQRHLSKEPSIFTTWREEVSRPFRTGALYAVPQGRPKNVAKIEKPHLQREKDAMRMDNLLSEIKNVRRSLYDGGPFISDIR